jgi:hypothetical protein
MAEHAVANIVDQSGRQRDLRPVRMVLFPRSRWITCINKRAMCSTPMLCAKRVCVAPDTWYSHTAWLMISAGKRWR